jgi:uncharacterized protein YqhQ
MANKKEKIDKNEVWMRIPIFIVSGIILHVWGFFIFCFALAQFIIILVNEKKEEELLRMCNTYLIQLYIFIKYVTFLSDRRPFPFGELEKGTKENK